MEKFKFYCKKNKKFIVETKTEKETVKELKNGKETEKVIDVETYRLERGKKFFKPEDLNIVRLSDLEVDEIKLSRKRAKSGKHFIRRSSDAAKKRAEQKKTFQERKNSK